MTVIFEYDGWVLTDNYIVTHGCLKRRAVHVGSSIVAGRFRNLNGLYCPTCAIYINEESMEKLNAVLKLVLPK